MWNELNFICSCKKALIGLLYCISQRYLKQKNDKSPSIESTPCVQLYDPLKLPNLYELVTRRLWPLLSYLWRKEVGPHNFYILFYFYWCVWLGITKTCRENDPFVCSFLWNRKMFYSLSPSHCPLWRKKSYVLCRNHHLLVTCSAGSV